MRNSIIVLLTALFLVTATVTAQDSEKEQTKMEEVMDAHDQVMDRMPELAKLIGKLETKADGASDKKKYHEAVKDLKAANKSMMDWMIAFGNRFEADEMYKGKELSEQKKAWVLEEQENIAILREEINLSIQQGQKLLNE
ncbi:MAG: hypothetical protein WBG48_04090 [Pricia sp.]